MQNIKGGSTFRLQNREISAPFLLKWEFRENIVKMERLVRNEAELRSSLLILATI